MKILDTTQILNILQNLSNLESSFIDYSIHAKDFGKFQTYFRFLDSYMIQKHDLWRLYFPYPVDPDHIATGYIDENFILPDKISIKSDMDFSMGKLFNFPDGPMHKCDYYTMIYVMEGSGELKIGDETFKLSPGDFYLIPPMVNYASGITTESIVIFFDLRTSFIRSEYNMIFMEDQRITSFITETFKDDNNMSYIALHSDNDDSIKDLVLKILSEYINQEKLARNAMKHYLCLLFTTLFRQNVPITSSQKVSRTVQRYQQIVDYLRQNYQNADLTTTADSIHFSKQYICRIVKEAAGTTFNELLLNIRLEHVCDYLLQTTLSIEKISELCGFSTPSHLSRCFKQKYGMAPSEYKKQNKEQPSV